MEITRSTKYTKEIEEIISTLGHATNMQILTKLRNNYPEVTATTVHRVTARLAAHGVIQVAPLHQNGAIRYDINLIPHDHFLCQSCGGIRDLDIASKVKPSISSALGGCKITGRLVIYGSCETCLTRKKGENIA